MPDPAPAMRAARVPAFGPPATIRLDTIPTPRPGDGQILVAVHAAAVTPLDTYLRQGIPVGDYTPTPPYTPGFALAGTVAALGPGATTFQPGDPVYGRTRAGAAAEFAICDTADLHPLPARIAFPDGALIAVPYETAYHALVDLARAAGGETVLVQGAAGSVGAASVQLARALGLRVIATCAPADRDAVNAHGAHDTIDFADPATIAPTLRRLTAGRGVDVVIEVAARANLALDLDVTAPGARIVIVGGTGQTPFDALPVIAKGLRILGVDLRAVPPQRNAQVHAAIAAGLENGTLRPRAAHRFPLDRIADAHTAVETRKGSGGVTVLIHPETHADPAGA